MGKLTLFTITLDTPNPVYTAGSTLQGCVTLELAEPMKMRGIRLRFYGGANVHWSERHTSGSGKNRRTTTRHYRSSQNYFDYMLVLYGKAPNQDGDNPVHPAGRHQYPFHYTLPQNLPSSFEGPHGQVRYWINCNIDKPWKFDHNSKIAYTVLSMLDLNNQANALAPQSGTNSKTLCCLCCESGPITAQFHIDRCGYVPGEFIVLSGEVSNHTNRTMDDNRVELRMYMTFRATTKTRTVMRMISRVSKGKIEAGGSAVWSGETFHIPPLPPSQLVYCDIIDIAYSIVLIVDPSGPAFDLEVPLKLCIGTVPLRNMYTSFASSMPMAPTAPPPDMYGGADGGGAITSAPLAAMPSAPPANNNGPPPPSYAECVLGKVDIREEGDSEHTHGQLNFAPTYSYYAWNQTPQGPGPQGPGPQDPGPQGPAPPYSSVMQQPLYSEQPQPYGQAVVRM